jgi:protein-disulfide isomerase
MSEKSAKENVFEKLTPILKGSKDAKIILIEYSDFECPFCSTFHSTAQQIKDEYGDDIAWVYRHFPLDFHERARPAAVASECATELGGNESFWHYIDGIFENQEENLLEAGLKTIAVDIGLNVDEFAKCLVSGNYDDKIEEQYQGGLTAGVNGTPGNIILNDKGEAWLIPGALPFETLKEAIDLALQD